MTTRIISRRRSKPSPELRTEWDTYEIAFNLFMLGNVTASQAYRKASAFLKETDKRLPLMTAEKDKF